MMSLMLHVFPFIFYLYYITLRNKKQTLTISKEFDSYDAYDSCDYGCKENAKKRSNSLFAFSLFSNIEAKMEVQRLG